MFKKVIAAASFLLLPWVSGAQNVDMFTGDFSYSVPLITLPAKNGPSIPFTLNYRAGIRPDQKASWVGLGWDMSTGEISRQVRGVPDDHMNGTVERKYYGGPFLNGPNPVIVRIDEDQFNYIYKTDSSSTDTGINGSMSNQCKEDLMHTKLIYQSGAWGGETASLNYLDQIFLSNPFFGGEMSVNKQNNAPLGCDYNLFNLNSNDYYPQGSADLNVCNSVTETSTITFKDQSQHRGKKVQVLRGSTTLTGMKYGRTFPGRFSHAQLGDLILGYVITDESGFKYYYTLPLFTISETQVSVSIEDESLSEISIPGGEITYSHPFVFNFKNRIKREVSRTLKPFVHTWKLMAITGPDYIDINNNQEADEGDSGYWIAYDYHPVENLSTYVQRSPEYGLDFNLNSSKVNLRTVQDNEFDVLPDFTSRKGSYTSTEKEYTYLEKVRSSTHTVFFVTTDRDDYMSRIKPDINNSNNMAGRKLNEVLLFDNKVINNIGITLANCQQYNMYSLTSAELQTDYSLCPNYASNKNMPVSSFYVQHPNEYMEYITFSQNATANNSGKLTLKKLILRGNEYSNELPGYDFTYNSFNPDYDIWKKDMWGFYNSDSRGITGAYNDIYLGTAAAENVDAWSLVKINPPSGEDIEIEYESDEYTGGKRYYLMKLNDNDRITSWPYTGYNEDNCYSNLSINLLDPANVDFQYMDGSLSELFVETGDADMVEDGKNRVGAYRFNLQILCAANNKDANRAISANRKIEESEFGITPASRDFRVKYLPVPKAIKNPDDTYNCRACPSEWPQPYAFIPDLEVGLQANMNCIVNGYCTTTANLSESLDNIRDYIKSTSLEPGTGKKPTAILTLDMQKSVGGGIRVKSIVRTDKATGKKTKSVFDYISNTVEYEPHPFVEMDFGYIGGRFSWGEEFLEFNGRGKTFGSSFGQYATIYGYPEVGYGNVTRTEVDLNGKSLGKTRFRFNTQTNVEVKPQLISTDFQDRECCYVCGRTDYYIDLKVLNTRYNIMDYMYRRGALLQTQVFDRENKLISENRNEYFNDDFAASELTMFDLYAASQQNRYVRMLHDQIKITGYDCGDVDYGNLDKYLYQYPGNIIPNYKHNQHVSINFKNGEKYPGFPGLNPLKGDWRSGAYMIVRPYIVKGTTSATDNVKKSSEIIRFDEVSGRPVILKNIDSKGEMFSYSIPAYKYFPAMGPDGTNQLSETAFNGMYSGGLNMNPSLFDNKNGAEQFVSGSLTKWSREAQQRKYNSTTGTFGNSIVQLPTLRPLRNWVWQGPIRPQADPLTDITFSNFIPDNNWKNSGNATLYDAEWNVIESENTVGRKSCTKLGYNNRYAIAACADASYAELALSGAEEEVKAIGSTAWLDSEISIQNSTQRTGYLAHTGSYSVLMTSTFPKAFTYRAIIGTDLKANRYYRAMVWVHNSNKDVELYYNLNGNTTSAFKGEVKYVNTDMQIQAGAWYLLSIEFVLSGVQVDNWSGGFVEIGVRSTQTNQPAYADDFRFQPADVTVGSKVYEPLRGLTLAELDNNNFAVKYVYDNSGRLVETYTEEEKKGTYVGGFRLVKKTTYNTSKKP